MIGQNCCAVCTNEVAGPRGHRDAFSSLLVSTGLLGRPLEPLAKREAMSALCHGLVVDSTFKRSENVAILR